MKRAVGWAVVVACVAWGIAACPVAAAHDDAKAKKKEEAKKQHAGTTPCAGCHTPNSWHEVTFAHERTGFALLGAHARTRCKSCHRGGFAAPLPSTCIGCHRDPHAGNLGLACDGCHSPETWQPQTVAFAHEQGSFPLNGRHAAIPCTECHRDLRDRAFSTAPARCVDCHAADYQRTALNSIDHAAAGFDTACQRCHTPWRFSPASFPSHDRCFRITSGPHAAIRCLRCHSEMPSSTSVSGACASGTAACSSCHEHSCSRTEEKHREVPGYQCKDRKCYECHRFAD